MTDFVREPWDQHGGFYRTITTTTPWVASPPIEPKHDALGVIRFNPVNLSLPLQIPVIPAQSDLGAKARKQRSARVVRLLRRRIATALRRDALPDDKSNTLMEPSAVSLHQLVGLHEWKAWGYYAYPSVNGVFVRNHPAAQPPPSTLNLAELIASLKSPGGNVHPERWIPGIEHPCLPPRPTRWIEPRKGDPLPFPWECQLNPFLEHLNIGPPPLCWHLGRPPSSIMFGQTQVTIPLSGADKCQPATWPFVTHMYINAIAEDPMPVFRWPIMVYNPTGIKCEDIFEAVYKNFQEHITVSEYESWEDLRQKPASLAFEVRNGQGRNDRLRRIDYLGTHHMFRGLEPNPNREGWIMFVGLA